MKTLKDILVRDSLLSGPLTPENGKSYNPALGEPKYYTAYRINETALCNMIKEWIELLEIEFYDAFKAEDWEPSERTEYIRGKIDILKKIFNLEND